MANLLARLLVKMTADSTEWQSGLQKAHQKTKSFEKEARQSLDKVAKAATAMGAAVTAATAVIVKQNLASIDSLAKTADKLGVTTEALGGLRHAANLTGVSQEKLDMSLQRMTRRLAEAAQGGGEAVKAINELGLNAQQLAAMSPDQAFAEIAGAMSQLENQSDKVRLAFKFFDSEGVALVNTMNLGAEGIRSAAQEADQLGMTLSRVDAAKVEMANDAMARSQGVLQGMGQTLTVQFAPYIEAVATHLQKAAKESGGFKKEITAALKAGITGASYLADVWRGWELIFGSLKVAFAALGYSILYSMEQWDRGITNVINSAIDSVNTLISGINKIPGIEIPELDGAEYSNTLATLSQASEEYFNEVTQNLRELAHTPMPSDNVKAWLAEVEAAAQVAAEKIAAASTGMQTGGVGGDPEDPEDNKQSEKLAAQLLALEESLMSEEERINASYERRKEMVNLAAEEGILTQQRQFELLESLYLQHQEKLTAIHEKGLSEREKFVAKSTGEQVKDVVGGLAQMTQATAKENKAMFAINKAASIGLAIINTSEGVTKTLAKYPGPLGIAMAAVTAAAGAAQIATIMSTSFGGGSPAPSVSAAGASDVVATTPTLAEEEDRAPAQVTNIYVQGNVFDLYETARTLAPEIRRAEGDGINRD